MLIINLNAHRLTDTTKGEILFVCLAVFPHHIYSELTCKTILFPKPSLYICQLTKRYMVHVQLLCRLLNTHILLFIVSTEVHRSCGLGISKLHDINKLRIRIWEYVIGLNTCIQQVRFWCSNPGRKSRSTAEHFFVFFLHVHHTVDV